MPGEGDNGKRFRKWRKKEKSSGSFVVEGGKRAAGEKRTGITVQWAKHRVDFRDKIPGYPSKNSAPNATFTRINDQDVFCVGPFSSGEIFSDIRISKSENSEAFHAISEAFRAKDELLQVRHEEPGDSLTVVGRISRLRVVLQKNWRKRSAAFNEKVSKGRAGFKAAWKNRGAQAKAMLTKYGIGTTPQPPPYSILDMYVAEPAETGTPKEIQYGSLWLIQSYQAPTEKDRHSTTSEAPSMLRPSPLRVVNGDCARGSSDKSRSQPQSKRPSREER